MKKIIIAGATSAIAKEVSKLFAIRGYRLYLVGRSKKELIEVCHDLEALGADRVFYEVLDLTDNEKHNSMLQAADLFMDGIDTLFVAYGSLPNQENCENSFSTTLHEFNTNCLSVLSLLTLSANKFALQNNGSIIVITSVAGDRGRNSNYIYGASKAAVSVFLQGLRGRLNDNGVQVLTVKPGFVDTPMTKSFKKGVLWVGPDIIAKGIIKAFDKRKNVVYLPWYWRIIMKIICSIPESIFKKINI
jgi:decaprenylphospho-beta-D-erythro-pentofuranosid-2-ulose 2-reductase